MTASFLYKENHSFDERFSLYKKVCHSFRGRLMIYSN